MSRILNPESWIKSDDAPATNKSKFSNLKFYERRKIHRSIIAYFVQINIVQCFLFFFYFLNLFSFYIWWFFFFLVFFLHFAFENRNLSLTKKKCI